MTPTQLHITENLLKGAFIVSYGRYIRLLDEKNNPLKTISSRTFYILKRDVLRKRKDGLFVIDKRKIRSIHGNSSAKRIYKGIKKEA